MGSLRNNYRSVWNRVYESIFLIAVVKFGILAESDTFPQIDLNYLNPVNMEHILVSDIYSPLYDSPKPRFKQLI